jgi:hypothetical protein
MDASDVAVLIDHMYWTNDRLLEAAADAGADVLVVPSTVMARNLRGTLVHELDVNGAGAASWPAASTSPRRTTTGYPDAAWLALDWSRDEAEMRAWGELARRGAVRLGGHVDVLGRTQALGQWLLHVLLHAAQ